MKKFLLFLLLVLILPGLSLAREKTQKPKEKVHPQPKEYFIDILLPHLWEGTKAVFSDQNVPYFALSTTLAGIAFTQDEKVRNWWLEYDPLGDWKVVGNTWGDGLTQAGLALSFWGAGLWAKNQKIASTGEVLMEAGIINGILTTIFKAVVGRERPDESGLDSFPSGHTSASFTFASVIDHRLGHAWGIPAYALALYTGMSRMESDVHWLSDVVMGAGLGMIVGYSVSRAHDDYPYEKRWHRTEKKKSPLETATFVPILPERKGEPAGFGILLTLD